MDGNIFNSEGRPVAIVKDNSIFDFTGKELYRLKGEKIYRLTGEFVGHLNATGSNMRLDKSSDRLFSKQSAAWSRSG
jgi:hypothetical protein